MHENDQKGMTIKNFTTPQAKTEQLYYTACVNDVQLSHYTKYCWLCYINIVSYTE